MTPSFVDQVYAYVSRIPAGRVMTYQAVARAVGRPRAARAVGNAMKCNTRPFYRVIAKGVQLQREGVPCHRVIRADGSLGGYNGGLDIKIRLLEREGVVIRNGRVAAEHVQQ